MNLDTNWKFKAKNIALQDSCWDYWHLGHIEGITGLTVEPLAHSYRNIFYCLYNKLTLSIEIPSICKVVGKKIDEINTYHRVGNTVSVGLFRSFTQLRMAAHYKGVTKINKVESLHDSIPTLPELDFIPFPEGRELYTANSEVIKNLLLAKFNF